jgi:hypothetical protein
VSWLDWLGELSYPAVRGVGPVRRDVLIRNCYLNPVTSGRYRAHFTRAGFRVVDCPPLTGAGKNSADIHIVIDVLDLLVHPTWFDEVVLFSADADYTPVMLRLRAHDRRTVIVTSGPSAPAFRAACDHLVAEDVFIDEALTPGVAPVDDLDAGGAAGAESVGGGEARPDLRRRIAAAVIDVVTASDQPVVLAHAAQTVRDRVGHELERWAGAGSFKKLLTGLDLPGLVISPQPPSYIYDPTRHTLPSLTIRQSAVDAGAAEDDDLLFRVAQVTDLPRLTTAGFRVLYEQLVAEVDENGFQRTPTSRAVRDRCVEAGEPISRAAVNFVLTGLAYAGRTPRPGDDAAGLAAVFTENALRLCENARMELSAAEMAALRGRINPWEPVDEGSALAGASAPADAGAEFGGEVEGGLVGFDVEVGEGGGEGP